MFTRKYPSDTFDQALWKQFWHQNQRYHTLCLPCIADKRDHDRKLDVLKSKIGHRENPNLNWGAVMLQDASQAIITNWYKTANENIFGSNGRSRQQQHMDISDDDDEDDSFQRQWTQGNDLTSSTSSIAIFWMRTARARIQRKNVMGLASLRRGRGP